MHEQEKEFVAAVLKTLERCEVPASKVLLHKFIYFLGTQGITTGLRFEAYTYGPYSFELASTIGSMDFWDEIKVCSTEIQIRDLSEYKDDESLLKILEDLFQKFQSVIGELNFKNLECFGTVLYCANVIANYGDKPTKDAVVTEFKAWKKDRYTDEDIQTAYDKLEPYLPKPTLKK